MEWWQLVIGILIGLLLLGIIVIVHELGHFLLARKNGVEVEEFGIGFPPRAKVLGEYKGTLITLNWLPIGGFCKLKGESDSAKGKGTYGEASFWSKTKILLAGVCANFLLAALIFTILALVGMPKVDERQWSIESDTYITYSPVQVSSAVLSDSPASEIGLEIGDQILSLDGIELKTSAELPELTKQLRGQTVPIVYQRGGEVLEADVTLREHADGGYLGVSVGQSETSRSTWSAPIVGVVNAAQFAWWTVEGLAQVLADFGSGIIGSFSSNPEIREQATDNMTRAGDGISGPIGILGVLFPNAMMAGITQLIFISGLISISLAIMNILPIPGLDGGRWLLTAIFKIIKKPLTEELEAKINGIGMICLFILIILITFLDIMRLW